MYQSSFPLIVQLAGPYLGLHAPSLAFLCSSPQICVQPLEYRLHAVWHSLS